MSAFYTLYTQNGKAAPLRASVAFSKFENNAGSSVRELLYCEFKFGVRAND
eukprot:UN00304